MQPQLNASGSGSGLRLTFLQIISEKKTTRRPRRAAGAAAKAAITGQTVAHAATRRAAATKTAPAAAAAAAAVPGNVLAEKIIVSNLPTDVNEAQVKVCANFLKFWNF